MSEELTVSCCICYENTKDYAVTSCNHNFCNDCMRTYDKQTCPMCRQKITSFTVPYKDFKNLGKVIEKVVEVTKIVEVTKDRHIYVYDDNKCATVEQMYGSIKTRQISDYTGNLDMELEQLIKERELPDQQIKWGWDGTPLNGTPLNGTGYSWGT